MTEWQHINSAPKDGTRIIVYRPKFDKNYIPQVGMDYWHKQLNCWAKSRSDCQPTDWQPMPLPPEGQK